MMRQKFPVEYAAWKGARYRCYNPKAKDYPRYGGRGITMCEEWRASFRNFINDMGPKPNPKLSLDRIDNNGHYEVSNCKWSTQSEQIKNSDHTKINALLRERGSCDQSQLLAGLARKFGCDEKTALILNAKAIAADPEWQRRRRIQNTTPHRCMVCEKIVKGIGNFTRHMKTHTA